MRASGSGAGGAEGEAPGRSGYQAPLRHQVGLAEKERWWKLLELIPGVSGHQVPQDLVEM